jgi:CheY-like chemotaxis protein
LPGSTTGRQVAAAARALRPDIKVLFVTGYAQNAAIAAGHLDAGLHVMTKPEGEPRQGANVTRSSSIPSMLFSSTNRPQPAFAAILGQGDAAL